MASFMVRRVCRLPIGCFIVHASQRLLCARADALRWWDRSGDVKVVMLSYKTKSNYFQK